MEKNRTELWEMQEFTGLLMRLMLIQGISKHLRIAQIVGNGFKGEDPYGYENPRFLREFEEYVERMEASEDE